MALVVRLLIYERLETQSFGLRKWPGDGAMGSRGKGSRLEGEGRRRRNVKECYKEMGKIKFRIAMVKHAASCRGGMLQRDGKD